MSLNRQPELGDLREYQIRCDYCDAQMGSQPTIAHAQNAADTYGWTLRADGTDACPGCEVHQQWLNGRPVVAEAAAS